MKNNSSRGANGKIDYLEALRFLLACLTMAWHYYYFGPLLGTISADPVNFPALRYCSFGVDIFSSSADLSSSARRTRAALGNSSRTGS